MAGRDAAFEQIVQVSMLYISTNVQQYVTLEFAGSSTMPAYLAAFWRVLGLLAQPLHLCNSFSDPSQGFPDINRA